MGVGAGLYMFHDVVVKKFTFAISSPDEFLCIVYMCTPYTVIPSLHDTTGCQTGCQTGLTTVLNEQLSNRVVQPD